MKRIDFIKKVLFVIGISILLPIGNKAYPFLENQQFRINLLRQPFSNAKKQLPMAGGDDKKEEIYAPNEVLIGLKEGVDAQEVLKETNIKAESLGRIYDIKPAVNKFRKEYSANKSYKIDKDSQGWFWFLGKKYRAIDSVPDEEVFIEAYSHMSVTEKALYRSYKIKLPGNISVEEAVRKLESNSNIRYAQPNYLNKLYMVPDDPYYKSTGSWGQEFDDLWGIKKISCEGAWDISQGEGVVVAVIDTGVDYNHPDLKDNMWVNADGKYGYDFSDQDDDPKDYLGHGTHCAGTIAAVGNNGIGLIGVAPKAKIMSVKIFPNAYDDVCVQAIKYAADNGAKVLSNSWGPKERAPSMPIVEEAIDYAYDERGCVVVFAAGNANDDVAYYSPANYSKTISVAATDHNDLKAYFSNWGDVDIAAPGGGDTGPQEIYNPYRSILSLLSSVVDDGMTGSGQLIVGGSYLRQAGTSMACPHISGVCALILGNNPILLPEQVKYILKTSADVLPDDSVNAQLNCGRANAKKTFEVDTAMFCFSNISGPKAGSIIEGKDYVDVMGVAYGEHFSDYILEYKLKSSEQWVTITQSTTSVEGPGLLGQWDIKGLADGDYTLRLRVFNIANEGFVTQNTVSINNIISSITEPVSGVIRDLEYVDIKAIASGYGFSSYILDYKLDTSDEWVTITSETTTAVIEPSIIGKWDVRELNDGQYTLRLRVFYKDKMYEKTSTVDMELDNLKISNPKDEDYLKSKVEIEIKGIACGYGFTNYVLEYSFKDSGEWTSKGISYDGTAAKNTEDSLLGKLDTSVIDLSGEFYLRLTVNYSQKQADSESVIFFYDTALMPGFPVDIPEDLWSMYAPTHISLIDMPDNTKRMVVSNGAQIIYLVDSNGAINGINRLGEMDGGCGQEILGPLSVGDLYGDGQQEIIPALYQLQLYDYDTNNWYWYDKMDVYKTEPHGNYIWWVGKKGWSSPYRIIEWPWIFERKVNAGDWWTTSGRNAVVDDLDRDGKTMEVVTKHTAFDLNDFSKGYTVFYMIKSNGVPAVGWPIETPITTGFEYMPFGWEQWPAPTTANLDDSPEKEIITWDPVQGLVAYGINGQIMPGWLLSDALNFAKNAIPWHEDYGEYGFYLIGKLTAADIDRDGKYEIIVRDSNGWLWVFDNFGGVQQKIQVDDFNKDDYDNYNLSRFEVPIADIDKDGKLEIIVAVHGGINIYRYEVGGLKLVYSISILPSLFGSNIVVGDADGDNELEIIMYLPETKEIAVFKLDGQKVMSRMFLGDRQAIDLTLTDLDKDGKLELLAVYNFSPEAWYDANDKVFMWKLDGNAVDENMPWPLEGYDLHHTGRVDIKIIANQPPVADNQLVTTQQDNPLDIVLTGSDGDGDALSYIIVSEPAHGSLSGTAPNVKYAPNTDFSGDDEFTFKVNDTKADSNIAKITIKVTLKPINHPPVLDMIGSKTVRLHELLKFTLNATDPDNGDTLTYSANNLPAHAVFYASDRTLCYMPVSDSQIGVYENVHFEVSDGVGLKDSEDITITVTNSNHAPELAHVGSKTVLENELLEFTFSATDADGDPLEYSVSNLPPGAVFDADNKTFSWTPGYGQADMTYKNIKFKVKDYKAEDSEDITIAVINVNCTAYWNLDQDLQDLVGDNDSNISGTESWSEDAMIDKALFFDGQTYVTISDNETLDKTNKLTISFWMKPTNQDWYNHGARGVISKRAGSNNNQSYSLFLNGKTSQTEHYYGTTFWGKMYFDIDGSNDRFMTNMFFIDNIWYHVTMVYDGTLEPDKRVNVYIHDASGCLLDKITAKESSASIPNYASDLYLGTLNAGYGSNFDGLLDDVRIYREALSYNEIEKIVPINTPFMFLAENPYAASQPTVGGRIIKVFQWNGKLYIGYGDGGTNTGPIVITSYDLRTGAIEYEHLSNTEAISLFRTIGDKFYALQLDPRYGSRNTNYSVTGKSGPWSDLGDGNDMIHVYDIATLNGTDLWLVGSKYINGVDYAVVMNKKDNASSWSISLKDQNYQSPFYRRFCFVGGYKNKLYVQDVKTYSKVYDGTAWLDGPNLLPHGGAGTKPLVFNDKMVYRDSSFLMTFDGASVVTVPKNGDVIDFTVDGNILYALYSNGKIICTNDLLSWEELPQMAPATCSSIAVSNGVIYIGTVYSKIYALYPNGNLPPVVNAGEDQILGSVTEAAELRGIVSDDKSEEISVLWEKLKGPGEVAFSDACLLNTSAVFSVPGKYVLRLTADDGCGQIHSDDINVIILLPAQTPVAGEDPQYEYFEGTFNSVEDLRGLTPKTKGFANDISLSAVPEHRSDRFGIRFSGYIEAPQDGIYTFYTKASDGVRVYLDGSLVVDNDGIHIGMDSFGKIGLMAGKHKLEVLYISSALWGIDLLWIGYEGPGVKATDRPGRVIDLEGFNNMNFFDLRKDDGASWNNASQFNLQWDMKMRYPYDELFKICVVLKAVDDKTYYLYYSPCYEADKNSLSGSDKIFGLGRFVMDGRWHTFTRDLKADLQAAYGLEIKEVRYVYINGNARFDDIRLSGGEMPDTIYEDGEDGKIAGWSIWNVDSLGNSDPPGAKVTNTYDYGPVSVNYVSILEKEDINKDELVDVLDVQLCVNVILGVEINFEIVDRAGKIILPENICDVVDLQAIINRMNRPDIG